MSIHRRFRTEVTITEPSSAATRYSDDVPDFDHPASVTVAKGWLVQSTATEEIGGRDVTMTVWILLLPPSTAISAAARVSADTNVFEVDGEPTRHQHGRNPHVAVRLRVVSEVTVS